MNIDEVIFSRVVKELNKMDIDSIYELAEECGLTYQCLFTWKEGRVISPRIGNVITVANALGLKISISKPHVKKVTKLRLVL